MSDLPQPTPSTSLNQSIDLTVLNSEETTAANSSTTSATTAISPVAEESPATNGTEATTIEIASAEEPQQILSQLRSTMERRIQESTQSWRTNLSNVFQEIRPLVQHAQSVNNSNLFNNWIPSTPTTASPTPARTTNSGRILNQSASMSNIGTSHPQISGNTAQQQSRPSGDSFVINLDGHGMQPNGVNNMQPSISFRVHPDYVDATASTAAANSMNSRETIMENNRRIRATILENANLSQPETADQQESSQRSQPTNNNTHQHQPIDDGPVAEAFAQMPEARALVASLVRYVPYICIILVKTSYDHLDGILDFVALFITFSHANWVVRQEIARHGQRSILKLLREMLYIVLVIFVIGFMLEKKNIFISVMFANSYEGQLTLRQLLFSVGVTDLILKLITVGIKILIALIPGNILEYKGRGRIYLMTEAISQFYRGLAPIQPWLVYLLDSYTGSDKLIGVAFSAAYMVAKGSDLVQTALFVKRSSIELFKKVSFGTKPTKEQLQTAGGQCPICHDNYASPVLLECTHIFCELCVGTWFDREQTCPLCRAKVVDDPSWRDGATTLFVQLY